MSFIKQNYKEMLEFEVMRLPSTIHGLLEREHSNQRQSTTWLSIEANCKNMQ